MPQNIEDTVCESSLPVNSRAMLNRLLELLEEHETNSFLDDDARKDVRVHKVIWLINQQVFGQLARIDMSKEWECVCDSDVKDVEYCKRSFREY